MKQQLIAGIFFIFMIAGCGGGTITSWDFEKIEAELPAPIPEDATNFGYTGTPRTGVLKLWFTAPPQSMMDFLAYFCDGERHQGYDPFNAINIGEPFTFAYPITVANDANSDSYYSFSPHTPPHLYGNQCLVASNTHYRVLLDVSDQQVYAAIIDVGYSCDICERFRVPFVMPIEGVEVKFLGIKATTDGYVVPQDEICFGIRYADANGIRILRADIRIVINNQPVASAYVADSGELIDRRDAAGQSVSIEKSGDPFYYCFDPDLPRGNHTVYVVVSGRDGITEGSFTFSNTLSN